MKSIQEVFPLLEQPKKIIVTAHHKPDGDAVGSILGMLHYLRKKGHTVTGITPSAVPDFLMWMPGATALIDHEATPDTAAQAIGESDIIFCLDFNDHSRTKGMEPLLQSATRPRVLIDHHMFPKETFEYGISQPEKSSTCEMVYDFICLAGDVDLIDSDIATCIYTGTMTDTGSFRFPATTASVHRMIAVLKDHGLDHAPVHEHVYDSWSADRMRFIGYMLIERMQLFPEYKAGLITISRADMKLFNMNSGDTEGLVQYPLSVRGIRFSTLITERGDEVKLSFRSKGDFDVNHFARTYFSGGGHFNASGGKSNLSFNETIDRFKENLSQFHPR